MKKSHSPDGAPPPATGAFVTREIDAGRRPRRYMLYVPEAGARTSACRLSWCFQAHQGPAEPRGAERPRTRSAERVMWIPEQTGAPTKKCWTGPNRLTSAARGGASWRRLTRGGAAEYAGTGERDLAGISAGAAMRDRPSPTRSARSMRSSSGLDWGAATDVNGSPRRDDQGGAAPSPGAAPVRGDGTARHRGCPPCLHGGSEQWETRERPQAAPAVGGDHARALAPPPRRPTPPARARRRVASADVPRRGEPTAGWWGVGGRRERTAGLAVREGSHRERWPTRARDARFFAAHRADALTRGGGHRDATRRRPRHSQPRPARSARRACAASPALVDSARDARSSTRSSTGAPPRRRRARALGVRRGGGLPARGRTAEGWWSCSSTAARWARPRDVNGAGERRAGAVLADAAAIARGRGALPTRRRGRPARNDALGGRAAELRA